MACCKHARAVVKKKREIRKMAIKKVANIRQRIQKGRERGLKKVLIL